MLLQSPYLLAVLAIAPATAVDIRNYASRGCSADYVECTNINMLQCCDRRIPAMGTHYFRSSKFLGMDSISLGLVFTEDFTGPWPFTGNCGKFEASVFGWNGRDVCVDGPEDDFLAGSKWFGLYCDRYVFTPQFCRDIGIRFPLLRRDDNNLEAFRERGLEAFDGAGTEGCTDPVKPNKVVFGDGHMFNTGPETPDEDADLIFTLYIARTEFKDMPEHLLQYEIEQDNIVERRAEIGHNFAR